MATTKQLYANHADSTIAAGIGIPDTVITCATGEGSKFPQPTNTGDFFLVTLEVGTAREIVKCTARSGDVFTVVRGQENTSPATWSLGTTFQMRFTATTIANLLRAVERLDELAGLDNLLAPSVSNSNSYLIHTLDDGSNNIVVTKDTASRWSFDTHKKRIVSSTISSATTTSATSGGIATAITNGLLVNVVAGKYIIQFTSGTLAGNARIITSASGSTVNWTTSTGSTASNGDSFEIYQSDYSIGNDANTHDPISLKLIDPRLNYNVAPVLTVSANALTITAASSSGAAFSPTNLGYVAQRSATLNDATHNLRTISANTTLVISSGSTLGHTSAKLCPIYIYFIDNAGTQEVAASGSFQGETGIFTTVAEGGAGAATSLTTMYSTTARSNLAGKLFGIAWSKQTTAGTWASVMTEVKTPPFLLLSVGEIVDYGGGVVPYGFFLQDNSAVDRTTYGKLFGKIGTSLGPGDGSTTFGVGDSRRRTLVGSGGSGTGTLGNTVGNSGGEENHTLTQAETPLKTHSHGSNLVRYSGVDTGHGTQIPGNIKFVTTGGSTDTAGDATASAHNVIQPSLVVTKMIRWLGDL